jgi:hypothetical protein
MTADEYAAQVLATTETLAGKLTTALAPDCVVVKRYKHAKVTAENGWLAALRDDGNTIRKCSLRMFNLSPSDEAATAGANIFKPNIKFGIEVFQDYKFGTDADNSEDKFKSDMLKIQYVLEANKNLSPAYIQSYSLNLGMIETKAEMIHYGEGEVVLMFRSLRYET